VIDKTVTGCRCRPFAAHGTLSQNQSLLSAVIAALAMRHDQFQNNGTRMVCVDTHDFSRIFSGFRSQ
jgi:hypothetical protein